MSSRVSERGQITIAQTIREALGVEPGMIAYQRVVNGRLEIVFLPAPHQQSLAGILHRPHETLKVLSGADLEEAVMEAVAEEEERSDAGPD